MKSKPECYQEWINFCFIYNSGNLHSTNSLLEYFLKMKKYSIEDITILKNIMTFRESSIEICNKRISELQKDLIKLWKD